MRRVTEEMFKREKSSAISDIRTALMYYRKDYDRFVEFVNSSFLEFGNEEDERGRIVGKYLLITFGGPTFYIVRYCNGSIYFVFSWEYTIRRKVRSGSRAEREIGRLFDILEGK